MNVTKLAARVLGLVLVGAVLTAQALSDNQKAEIEERIKPAGSVCLKGDTGCGAATASVGGGAQSPEDIYNSNCMACHATGAAGAPKTGDVAGWKPRIGKGIDTLYTHAIKGFNGMPPMGLCMSCSEDDIKAVVDYIVEKSQ